jgi:hypothetical protein
MVSRGVNLRLSDANKDVLLGLLMIVLLWLAVAPPNKSSMVVASDAYDDSIFERSLG